MSWKPCRYTTSLMSCRYTRTRPIRHATSQASTLWPWWPTTMRFLGCGHIFVCKEFVVRLESFLVLAWSWGFLYFWSEEFYVFWDLYFRQTQFRILVPKLLVLVLVLYCMYCTYYTYFTYDDFSHFRHDSLCVTVGVRNLLHFRHGRLKGQFHEIWGFLTDIHRKSIVSWSIWYF